MVYVKVNYFVILIFGNIAGSFARQEMFTIDTEGCKIPAYPLINDNIRNLITPPSEAELNCNNRVIPLVTSNRTHISVLKEKESVYQIMRPSEFYCCYRNFSAQGNVENIAYGVCEEFTEVIKGRHEFVRVECYYYNDKIYEDVFKFNVYKKKAQKIDNKSFNVLMFGMDSVSRKNFLRTMPKTASFLKLRGSIQLHGYNKLGDNSLPNLIAMLAGKSIKDAENICFKNNIYNSKACPFMWDLYKNADYRTALGSDSAVGVLGTYEPLLPYKPTDYYIEAFNYETRHCFNDRTYDYHLCIRNRFMYKELLNFAKDVLNTERRGKLFGLFWEESVSHNRVNTAYIMDEEYLNLLRDMEKKKILEDAIVILFSDHGTRFGDILHTEEGHQESRLPLFEIIFPMRFRRKYKQAYTNFETNSRRLTTPYDVHQTLKDIINISSIEDHNLRLRAKNISEHTKSVSLFLPIPATRTCKSIHISEHWCSCLSGEVVSIGAKRQASVAKYLMKHINQILSEYPQCHKLSIEKVVDVMAIKNEDTSRLTYRVLLQAKPGGGVFESTLLQLKNAWVVSGSVSRLNSYKNQSHCVKDPLIKLYCYCRKPK